MAGFRKAKAEQAALKMALYGPAGSGKTFTALLVAEGIAEREGKRVAFVDTERGTDFYATEVLERQLHPAAFDFDALYSRSMTDVSSSIRGLDPKTYGVVVIDSMTHIWEAAVDAYRGRTGSGGQIPFHAWGRIKKPYKDLISYLLSSSMHVILCGRQGYEYGENDEGETTRLGYKMKAEGETAYEPHVLIRMEAIKGKDNRSIVTAHVEKDRSGILAGKSIPLPPNQGDGFTFKKLGAPLLGVLSGDTQAQIESSDEVAARDAVAMEEAEKAKEKESAEILRQFKARFDLCSTQEEIDAAGKEITAKVKKQMRPSDVKELRAAWSEAGERVRRSVEREREPGED